MRPIFLPKVHTATKLKTQVRMPPRLRMPPTSLTAAHLERRERKKDIRYRGV